jgi:hypothetical protein
MGVWEGYVTAGLKKVAILTGCNTAQNQNNPAPKSQIGLHLLSDSQKQFSAVERPQKHENHKYKKDGEGE